MPLRFARACTQAYFQGNAPSVNGGPGSADGTVFQGETGTAYYLPGTTGWGATFGGWPTAVWSSPATDFTYLTNNGAITITGYTGPGGQVIIPGTINTHSVTAIGTNAFYGQTNLTVVAIPNSVTSIGDDAFQVCSSLTNVTLPDSVTSIAAGAFYGCSHLTNVTIPDSVTSIGEAAFIFCSSLTSVAIPTSVTNIGVEAFGWCSGLTNIVVNNGNPSYASAGGVLFNYTLTTLIQYPGGLAGSYTIPDSVTSIGNQAFAFCSDLTSVTIPDSVTNIADSAFEWCSGLTSVTIGNNVTNIGTAAFNGCSGLTSVTIPNSVASIGAYAFQACSGLTSVTIPDSVTDIGAHAFYDCSSLASATIGNSVTSIGEEAFFACDGLTSVTIPGSVTSIGAEAFANSSLHQAYFRGKAPSVNGGPGSADTTVFFYDGTGTVYYVPGTTGWGAQFGGWPTAGWYQPRPQILGSGYGLGVGSQGFQFTISWATNTAVVVEASTNLQDWTPVATNTLVSGTNLFWDSDWTHYPQRFYRVGVGQ
jgi:BspA type Leucine rich repeat region (6 copies)